MLAAGVIHATLIVMLYRLQADVPAEVVIQDEENGEAVILGFVDVHFGPPEIFLPDGTTWNEPRERVLDVRNFDLLEVHLPEACYDGPQRGLVPAEARLRLELNVLGRISDAKVESSEGDACRDGMLTAIAESLWYHWLPNEEFPAPVDLIQPVRMVAATGG